MLFIRFCKNNYFILYSTFELNVYDLHFKMANFITKLKYNLTENSLQSLIWLIDLVPNIFGYSYVKNKVGGNFFMNYVF